jgi:hypothetical protein
MTQPLLFPLLLFVTTVATLLGVALYVHYRILQLSERLSQTAAQVEVFAEASVALGEFVAAQRAPAARTPDASGADGTSRAGDSELGPAPASPGAARSLLLRRAVEDFRQGVPLAEVVASCELSGTEAALLSRLPG